MLRSTLAAVGLAALFTTGVIAQTTGGRSAFALRASAHLQQPIQPRPDVLSQLLSEVHELRLVLQRQGADSARIQLLISRLSIQETRVSRLARDLDDVREQLGRTVGELARGAERVKDMEGVLASNTDPNERSAIEQQTLMMRRQLVELRAQEQRLRAREAELDSSYGSEQARWVEISNRLDELERTLARP